MDARAARLGHELQDLAQVRDGPGLAPDLLRRPGDRGAPPLDPRPQLAHGILGVALGRAPRQHDLDLAVAVDADPDAPGAVGAADAVRHGHDGRRG